MQEAYLVDAVRTPLGKHNGSFRELHPQDLAAKPLEALAERNRFTGSEDIEDVIYGCVTPIDEQGMNIGRLAPMVAGWGEEVPGVQLNRMCGSGQQAVNFAAGQIRGGMHDVLVAGGVEHMTRVPMASDGASEQNSYADDAIVTDSYFEYFDELTSQGEGAERIADKWGFTRDDLDAIAVDSQRRWGEAAETGKYDDQIIPVETEVDGEVVTVDQDEHPRPGTEKETLRELPLVFRQEGDGVIHAGNSSGIVDGSAAVLTASETACEDHGWDPMAKIVDTHVVGVDPKTMLTGPIPATNELLAQNDLAIDEIDRFEVNEAFASVILAWLEETGAEWEKTNVWGGAIAHGHPLGATGSILLGKLAHQLEECNGRYGLCTMCIGFGQGVATLIERV
ncbi:thiolase family protein [Halorussus salinisoli]|uniref:thiolase family protein n=1 Tax=Halorussus salinisoli TaxID=2558242 RepID=UPI0010C15E9D|nr:thiolase family protein [Halorussus salinisoli]